MKTLDANFEVLQETLIFYIEVFVIREPQLTIPVLNYLDLNHSLQANLYVS